MPTEENHAAETQKAVPAVTEPAAADLSRWVAWLRSAAPYVHLFHGKTFVISFAGEVVADTKLLNRLVMDASLIASLGIKLVLVHGSRPQIEELMQLRGLTGEFHKGVRITDEAVLECVKEACGETRFDIEAAFSQGLPNTPMQHSRIRVVSGNFVTARPMGIIDGVDFRHTGLVRKVDAQSIEDVLNRGFVVLVSPFGFSPTGEGFNLTTEDVATSIASAIKADKLILQVEVAGVRPDGVMAPELTATQAEKLIGDKRVDAEDVYNLNFALKAIRNGVSRVHIVPWMVDGAILAELFTHDGVGTMIAEENMESMREAVADDVGGIMSAKSVTLRFWNTTASFTARPPSIPIRKLKSGKWPPLPCILPIRAAAMATGFCAASSSGPANSGSRGFLCSPRAHRTGLSITGLRLQTSRAFRLKSSACTTGTGAHRFLSSNFKE